MRIVTKKQLEPLRKLAHNNETHDRGVGVWLKDAYSRRNRYNNVFDPVVSLSVTQFLQRIFRDHSEPTEKFIRHAQEENLCSFYYPDSFRALFFYLFGEGEKPQALENDQYRLFHHGNRTNIWYASPDVWEAAELVLATI